MIKWTPGTPFSTKKLWLRRIRASFHLYRRLIVVFLFVIFSLSLTILSIGESPIVSKMRGGILFAFQPFVQIVQAPLGWAKSGKDLLASWILVHRRQEALMAENASLQEKIVFLEPLQGENEELRKLLNAPLSSRIPFLTAEVLAYPGRPYAKNLLLKGGEEMGIQPFQVVMHEKGLVGRVLQVTQSNAHVLLITDVNSHIPVISKDGDIQGILMGRNDRLPFIRHMDIEKVKVGDIIETSGKGGIFPPRLPVGEVVKIDGDDVIVRPFCPLDRLSFVLLMRPVIHFLVEQLVHHATPRSS